jgi:hypothetical protein
VSRTSDVVFLAGTVHAVAELLDEGSIVLTSAGFNIQINTIKDSVAEWTSRARTTKEQVPDGISELAGLSVRAESGGASSATQAEGDDLALGLASLNVGSQELAVGESSAGEHGTVRAADLSRGVR